MRLHIEEAMKQEGDKTMNNRWRTKKRYQHRVEKNMLMRFIALSIPNIPKATVKVSGKAEAGEFKRTFDRAGVKTTYDKKTKVVTIG